MSNIVGHSLLHRALCLPPITENQSKTHLGFSGSSLGYNADHAEHKKCKPVLSNSFLGNSLSATRAKSSKGNRSGYMVPRAVLATDPSSELAGKFNLDAYSELQVSFQAPVLGAAAKIDFRITNGRDGFVLHWGAISERKKDWVVPFRSPDGTKVYKNKALRTPFIKSGPDSFLNIEIDDPEIRAIEFLVIDEAQNRWFKNNGENFQVKLPGKGHQNPNTLVVGNKTFSLPEDLVQINAYLRWEREGRQSYTPDQEKDEYEAARVELLEEIGRGASIEELQAKLTKKPDDSKKDDTKNEVTVASEIPDDLVQVQAYLRWERAGKPNYSPEKQLMEFEEARKELLHLLGKGAPLSGLRQKLMGGNRQTEVSEQLKTKKYFTIERIQRKKRDIMQLLNKYSPESPEANIPSTPKTPTAFEALSEAIEKENGAPVINKKFFKLGDKELLVLVLNSLGKTKVYLATDQRGPVFLHWALSRMPGEWMLPPSSALPPNSVLVDVACETPFVEASLNDKSYQAVEIEIDGDDYDGIPFVLRSDGTWIKNGGSDFYVEFRRRSTKSSANAGDGKGTAKSLLDRIAELESEAQKSLMHRFNIAAASGKLGLSGILFALY